MNTNIEIDDSRLYYKMGEAAEILGESTSLVRFWADSFPKFIKPVRTVAKNNRQFTPADMRMLQKIHFLVKEQRMTLEGARKRLENDHGELDGKIAAIRQLTSLREQLKEIHDLL